METAAVPERFRRSALSAISHPNSCAGFAGEASPRYLGAPPCVRAGLGLYTTVWL